MSIRTVLANEKYCGAVMLGKTYVADYFTGHPTINRGEAPKYVVEKHHKAIVDPFD